MQRRRFSAHRISLVLALAVAAAILAACGGGDATPAPGVSTSSTSGSAPTSAVDDGPIAPDFTLSLEPEGEFVLSETDNPVYLVFWAEW